MTYVDLDAGIQHAGGNRALYLRFARRFQDDPTFWVLQNALYNGDISLAFRSAHTLKGIAAQLGFSPLARQAGALCELLRPQDTHALKAARAHFHALRTIYESTLSELSVL